MKSIKHLLQIFLLAFAIISIIVPVQTLALTRDQRFEIERRYWYDKTDCTVPNVSTGVDDFSGANNGEIAFNFLVGKNLTDEQAAGIVGNMQLESGVDPKAVNSSSGATGIIQWLGGRKDALFAFGQNQTPPEDPLTLQLQLRYLWHEMTQTAETPNFNDFKSQTANERGAEGAARAAIVFEDEIERSGGAGLEARQEYARQAFGLFAGGATGIDTGLEDPCTAATVNGVGGIDAFPLRVTQSIIRTGADGSRWCFSATTSCHGSYRAADIVAPTGTPVLAAKGGTVTSVTNSTSGDYMSIKGDDNVYTYYYTHMGFNSITISEGQVVTTGQQIGVVGTAAEAENTIPHLHFDMLPADKYNERPACSRESCPSEVRDLFIDPQPMLKQIFDQLPN